MDTIFVVLKFRKMNSWFTVKVKYTKQLEDGQLKRVTEPYLLDAVSFTDAEARIYEEMGQIIRGEFIVTNIAKTEFADIFQYEDEFLTINYIIAFAVWGWLTFDYKSWYPQGLLATGPV